MTKLSVAENYWSHPYVKKLPPLGKLALCYASSFEDEGKPVILEDMSLATGQDITACQDWLEQFEADRMLMGLRDAS
jgi:hypothetical protein